MSNFKITRKQGMWLDQQGGRNESDIRASKATGSLFVVMSDGYGNNVKVFIPDDKDLKYKESENSYYVLVERVE